MIKQITIAAAAAAMALTAVPATAQDEEEPRTTYRIELLRFKDGGANAWDEARTTYVVPARAELGLPSQEVHWLMAGEWQIMTITEMPGGLATLDTHGMPRGEELQANIRARFESEEAANAKFEEVSSGITGRMVTYSHTHP